MLGREPGVVVINPAMPAKTLQEFIAYVKARPGQIDYASSGNGSGQHLFAALLARSPGMKMNHMPYRGSGQATTDLLGGQVQMSIPGMAGMLGNITVWQAARAGRHRREARAAAAGRADDDGGGRPGLEAYVWMGLLAPKGTPAPIIDKLNERGDRGAGEQPK